MKLNFGSGETKLEGFVNIDLEPSSNPDVICDIRKSALPFEDGSVELIQMFHSIEHIEQKWWTTIFAEFRRVLEDDGVLLMAYPEFEKCAINFIENYRGLKEFWKATLYGRQLYPGDYHVVPMVTGELVEILKGCGFVGFKTGPDPDEDHNSILFCRKGPLPLLREEVLRKEIFER